jgi:hypothetical protein
VCTEEGEILTEEVERLVQIVEEEVQVHYDEVVDLAEKMDKRDVKVYFVDGSLARDCKEIKRDIFECSSPDISGVYLYPEDVIYAEYEDCLAWSSLVHEILHFIEFRYLNIRGEDHSTEHMFRKEYGVESIEWKTKIRAAPEFPRCQ